MSAFYVARTSMLRQGTSDYARLFEDVDVLMCPTLATVPPKLGWLSGMEPFPISANRPPAPFAASSPPSNTAPRVNCSCGSSRC